MHINSITIKNFRTFYGVHPIQFSTDENKPVTIFIGENGAGKTTLLNAVYWAFTGIFSKQFDASDEIINRAALDENINSCSVEVSFSNGKTTYSLERTLKRGSRTSDIKLSKFEGNSGHLEPISPNFVEALVQQLMPQKLASWFFFDGEAIGALHLDGDSDFKRQLHKTFGFSSLATLKSILAKLENDYRKEESRSVKSEELDDITQKLDHLDADQLRLNGLIELNKRTIHSEENKKKDYESRLLNYAQAEPIQNRRKIAATRLAEEKLRLTQKTVVRNSFLIKNLPKVILSESMGQLINQLNQKEEEQTLPEPFGTKLIEQIKYMQQCICGEEVLPGSHRDKCLDKMLERASTGQLMQKIFAFRSEIGQYKKEADGYQDNLSKLVSEINLSEEAINQQEMIIRKADEEILGIKIDEVRQIKEDLGRAEAKIRDAEREVGYYKRSVEDNNKDIVTLKAKQDVILAQQNLSTHLRSEREKVSKLLRYVVGEFKRQEAEVLDALNKEISGVFDLYLTKNYGTSVDPDSYAVHTYDVDGKPVSLSTGESNLLKFAVIAAIVGMAGQRTRISKVNWISEPIIAPLMFDAPFSVVDPGYRAAVTKNLSDLASQLILLFDSGKWGDELSGILNERIGKIYLLISRAKGEGRASPKTAEISGKVYELNEYGERDETLVKEIKL
jgi:DNA sulfur modification protein DndD